MFEDRADVAAADEEGGGGDEEYEINSMGKPSGTGKKEMPCGDAQGAVVKVATMSQHTRTHIRGIVWTGTIGV